MATYFKFCSSTTQILAAHDSCSFPRLIRVYSSFKVSWCVENSLLSGSFLIKFSSHFPTNIEEEVIAGSDFARPWFDPRAVLRFFVLASCQFFHLCWRKGREFGSWCVSFVHVIFFFSWLGVLINMAFLFFLLVVLLNILIAQLSTTYADVQADAQRELEQNWGVVLKELEKGPLKVIKQIAKTPISSALWIVLNGGSYLGRVDTHTKDKGLDWWFCQLVLWMHRRIQSDTNIWPLRGQPWIKKSQHRLHMVTEEKATIQPIPVPRPLL